jgi:hypothetical protein
MTTSVYIWRTFGDSPRLPGMRRLTSSSSRSVVSDLIGGFGHVALKVKSHYFSYWPPDDRTEKQSFSFSHQEDVQRCGRAQDRVIAINGLAEQKMIDKWRAWSTETFDEFEFNCCTVTSRLLMLGYTESHLDSARTVVRRMLRVYLRPISSFTRPLSYYGRELTIHSPGEVEKLADWLADVT